jgi:PIN domain nuclease of toxin-antitoxin system
LRLLLDTHTAIWAVDASRMLSKEVIALLSDPQNEVFVSAVSIWEIAIKSACAATMRFRFRRLPPCLNFAKPGSRFST